MGALPMNISAPSAATAMDSLSLGNDFSSQDILGGDMINFGEIIKSYVEGSPENGGYDVEVPNRYAMSTGNRFSDKLAMDYTRGYNIPLIVGAVGISGALLFFLLRRR